MAIVLPLRATSTQPKAYWLSQPYHNGVWYNPSQHHALDMVGYNGQPLYAVDSGRIFSATWNGDGWAVGGGYSVLIDHWGQGNRRAKSAYAHLSRLAVSKGQWVLRGQLIGYAGATGNVTGAHVHFSVAEVQPLTANPLYYNSYKWMDPRRYMRAHTYANGSQANGNLIGSWHLGRNTFRVNAGVNLRTNRYLTSSIVRATTAATDIIFTGDATGTNWNGSNLWFKGYDHASKREVWFHSTLGRWMV
jgi:murein DD-endopeptidase MepM/ murein hydrolase activator NlpD